MDCSPLMTLVFMRSYKAVVLYALSVHNKSKSDGFRKRASENAITGFSFSTSKNSARKFSIRPLNGMTKQPACDCNSKSTE
eukprot:snap_masked-scaffold_14-processed-gene-3.44-mRNA-1 protein AED:1.00 eAED:1.00 QI:0/0/0/0/1/1/3/0/80